jgi:hypothetical protein
MASVAEALRLKVAEVRASENSKFNTVEKKAHDVQVFYEHVTSDALEKMNIRAEKGANSANILEYGYGEFFHITDDNKVIRHTKFTKIPDAKLYRIFEIIRTDDFKELLDSYTKQLGQGIEMKMWWPGGNINVIEAVWGPTKYHNRNKKLPYGNKTSQNNIDENPSSDAAPHTTVGADYVDTPNPF